MKDFDVYKVHQDIYEYMIGKNFIITHENLVKLDKQTVPYGRPAIGKVVGIDLDEKVVRFKSHDYDQDVDFVVKYELPANFDILTKGNLCFHQVFEFKNHDVIVRFWEV